MSVVIPARNEERNIRWVLERLPAGVGEVILVDGDSSDGTVAVAREFCRGIVVVGQPGRGKGDALRAGFAAARCRYVVMLDADGSMDPGEIGRFVEQLRAGSDMVKGSRFASGGATDDMTLVRRVGNGTLLGMANRLYRTGFSDLCYGFMAFRREQLLELGLSADGFEIETEIVVRAVKAGLRIGEVPSREEPRRFGDSNLNTWRDGSRVLRVLLSERFLDKTRTVPDTVSAPNPQLQFGFAAAGVGAEASNGDDFSLQEPAVNVALP